MSQNKISHQVNEYSFADIIKHNPDYILPESERVYLFDKYIRNFEMDLNITVLKSLIEKLELLKDNRGDSPYDAGFVNGVNECIHEIGIFAKIY